LSRVLFILLVISGASGSSTVQGPRRPLHKWPPVKSAPAVWGIVSWIRLYVAQEQNTLWLMNKCRRILKCVGPHKSSWIPYKA